MEELRQKLNREPYKSYADILRKQTYKFLEREPEKEIRQYLAVGETPYGYSARDRDRGYPMWRPMEQCAFFGLIDRNSALTKMAARYAICLCHVRNWSEGFVEHDFQGSAVEWRSFFQNTACISLAASLDWMGAVLTDHAKEVICHSIYFKGLAPIKYDFGKNEYIYKMNQGTVFSAGRISALLALNQYWPRMGWELDQAEKDINETLKAIIFDDGAFGEGPAYYGSVIFYSLISLFLLARYRKLDEKAMIPIGILNSADYFGTYMSTTRKPGKLPLSDGGGQGLSYDFLTMLCRATDDPRWIKTLVEAFDYNNLKSVNESNGVWLETSVRSLIFGPDDLSRQEEIVPVFKINTSTGHATSRRETEMGQVRLHLCGSSPTEGHSHEDKGAIILEAFGEDLLIDRGSLVYNDPLCQELKYAYMHNLVTLLDTNGQKMCQINPCPKAICPTGYGNEKLLHLSMDTASAWGEAVKKMNRTVDSEEPLSFTITDEIVLKDECPVIFNFNSYYPIEVHGNTVVFSAQKSRLHVSWEWGGKVIKSSEELYDGGRRKVYRLAVCSEASKEHTLVTRMKIETLNR